MARKLHRTGSKASSKASKGDKPRKWIKVDGKWKRAASVAKAEKPGKKSHRHDRKAAKPAKKKARKATGKLTQAQLLREIADRCELTPKDVKAVLAAHLEVAYEQINSLGEFRIAGLVKVKVRDIPERPKGKYMVFGKKKKLPRRPAFRRLKALVLKAAKVECDALPPKMPAKK
jgi:nucleoid DNA-binding protein